MDSEVLYLNGRFLPLSEGRIDIEDRGFQLGDGVYEVVKVMRGRVVWLEDHLARLNRSLTALRLTSALAGHDLNAVLPRLVTDSGVIDGMVYVQVTRGVAKREFVFPELFLPTVLAYARSIENPAERQQVSGIRLHPVEDPRWARCDIKSTNLLASVLAKEEARDAGAEEALFVGADGFVREGGSSNVFAVIDGVLRTHPPDRRILAGITRRYVVEIARSEGLSVEERPFTLDEIDGSRCPGAEVFTASTLRDILPVVGIGDVVIGAGRPGAITLDLLAKFRALQAGLVQGPQPA